MVDRSPWISRLAWPAAFVVGLFGFGIFFSDSGSPDGWPARLAAGVALALAAGLLAGYLQPSRWAGLGIVVGWGPLAAGALGWAMGQAGSALILSLPLAGALGGALAGTWIRQRRAAPY